jgi:hypothetical protein
MPIVDTSSDAGIGITSTFSEDDVASTPLDTPLSVDVISTTNITDPESPLNSESEAKIDNSPGPHVYVITGVVIAIIVLGILTVLVAVVLFMKARYS